MRIHVHIDFYEHLNIAIAIFLLMFLESIVRFNQICMIHTPGASVRDASHRQFFNVRVDIIP
jgi:hypothetical protein